MRKPLLIPLAFAFIFALVSGASGQGANYTANPNPELQNNGLAMPGRNSTTGPSATGNNATTDEDDPSLQRLSSKDSLGPGMLRDDGQLTAKVRRREKSRTSSQPNSFRPAALIQNSRAAFFTRA